MAIEQSNRDMRTQAQKKNIIEIAFKLFYEYGFSNVSTADICKWANISSGSLYHHFGSKERLLYICIYKMRDEYIAEHYVHTADQPFETRFKQFFITNAEYNITIPPELLSQAYGVWGTLKAKHDTDPSRPYIKHIADLAEEGVAAQAFTLRHSADDIANIVNATLTGLAMSWSGGLYDSEQYLNYVQDLADIFLI